MSGVTRLTVQSWEIEISHGKPARKSSGYRGSRSIGNIGTVRHAETELARCAADAYPSEFLWTCTLVSTGEPCAMCTGTIYWSNIGRLVYGYDESTLLVITGDHPANPTMSLDAGTVLGSGQKAIKVYGPFPELDDELLALHEDF